MSPGCSSGIRCIFVILSLTTSQYANAKRKESSYISTEILVDKGNLWKKTLTRKKNSVSIGLQISTEDLAAK
jgi:hypothetical protein